MAFAARAAAAATIFGEWLLSGELVQSGDQNESRNKGYDVTSNSPGIGEPVQAGNEVIQSSEIDLRVDGISQEETYNDTQYMDEIKKQVGKLQDESKSKSLNEDLQKGYLLSKETSLKIKETTKNGDIAVSAMFNSKRGRISILSMRYRSADG